MHIEGVVNAHVCVHYTRVHVCVCVCNCVYKSAYMHVYVHIWESEMDSNVFFSLKGW